MGIDTTFFMFDRDKIDPLLGKTIKIIEGKRFNSCNLADIDLVSFCSADAITEEETQLRINTYSVREIMKCSDNPYYFLETFAGDRKYTRNYSARINVWGGLIGTAARAFLEGRLSKAAMFAVFKLTGSCEKTTADIFHISESEKERLGSTIEWQNYFNPIYRWQSYEPGDTCWSRSLNIINCLGAMRCRLFLKFLEKANDNNWPLPRVKKAWFGDGKNDVLQENIGDQPEFKILREKFCGANFKKPSIVFFMD